jgi:2-aminoadipate transaminase
MPSSHNTAPTIALSAKAGRTQEAPISALIAAAVANPDLISFAAGLVDPQTLPVDECLAITQKLFSDRKLGQVTLQYDTTRGLAPLRRQVLGHVESLEGKPASAMNVTPDDVILTTGSQQMLYLVADALVDPGDIVIAANPSYFVFAGTLQSLGAKVLSVPMDEDGMDVDAVDALLTKLARDGRLSRVKFIYCTSFFDNPTGLTLSGPRRRQLLDVARKHSTGHRILILEDAAYRELRYDGDALPSIKSYDERNEFVILTQTFSKPFAPGIKLGYTLLPHDLVDPILQQKGNHDFGSANVCQAIALEAMRSGVYHSHLELLKAEYRKKRDLMLGALDMHFSGLRSQDSAISWTRPHGGLYVWLTLPDSFDTRREAELFDVCVKAGVLYVPGDYCFQPDEAGCVPGHHMRLSFGQVAPDRIDPGIARLAEVIKSRLRAPAVSTLAEGAAR